MKRFRKKFAASFRRSPGIAILMVLSGLALISSVVVEFAYHSNVTYEIAMNDLDQSQAYYLAESGLNFSKLLLKYDKDARQMIQEASQKSGKNVQARPLYEIIPLDTALLRGLSEANVKTGDEVPEDLVKPEDATANPEASPEEKAADADEEAQKLAFVDMSGASTFLDFTGDFAAEIQEENAKINLNAFYSLPAGQKPYDRLKLILYHLLATPEFQPFFDDRYRGATELAQNIADYIDGDDVYNEPDGQERGRELGSAGRVKELKNGKLVSIEELALVPGMTEEIFQKLKPYVTLYGRDEKIYLCRAKEPIVRAVVLAYSEANPEREAVKDDNEELLAKAVEAVLNSCPDSGEMNQELDRVLGYDESTSSQEGSAASAARGGASGGAAAGALGSMIVNQANIFSIVSTGTVGETLVRITAVFDTSSGDAKQWKALYWKVE